jgi:hypothetical protein
VITRVYTYLATAAACVCVAAPAIGQAPAESQQQQAKTLDPNQVVCEKIEVVGSRVAVKRVCMTRSQWAERRLQDRQDLEQAQTRRGMKGE